MTQQFTAVRTLSIEESALPGAVDLARQSAFKEAVAEAHEAWGDQPFPQDHSIDETVSPSDEGGTEIIVAVTLPD